jgi:hypothetical protein
MLVIATMAFTTIYAQDGQDKSNRDRHANQYNNQDSRSNSHRSGYHHKKRHHHHHHMVQQGN